MCIRWHCYLACTRCNNQFYSETENRFITTETARELLDIAKSEGWRRAKVQNGTMWDFCPRCWARHQQEAQEQEQANA